MTVNTHIKLLVHIMHCIGEIMNDPEVVDYSSSKKNMSESTKLDGEQLMRSIHCSSLFLMFIESIDFKNSGLYMENSLLNIKNKEVKQILMYCSNSSWPQSVIEFLKKSLVASTETKKLTKNEKEKDQDSYNHDDLFSGEIDFQYRNFFLSGLKKYCPYLDPGTVTPFEIMQLLYVAYLKKVVVHRSSNTSRFPEIIDSLKKDINLFIRTGSNDSNNEKSILFKYQNHRDLFDCGTGGFSFEQFLARICEESNDLISEKSFLKNELQCIIKETTSDDVENKIQEDATNANKPDDHIVTQDNEHDDNNFENQMVNNDDDNFIDQEDINENHDNVNSNHVEDRTEDNKPHIRQLRDRSKINKPIFGDANIESVERYRGNRLTKRKSTRIKRKGKTSIEQEVVKRKRISTVRDSHEDESVDERDEENVEDISKKWDQKILLDIWECSLKNPKKNNAQDSTLSNEQKNKSFSSKKDSESDTLQKRSLSIVRFDECYSNNDNMFQIFVSLLEKKHSDDGLSVQEKALLISLAKEFQRSPINRNLTKLGCNNLIEKHYIPDIAEQYINSLNMKSNHKNVLLLGMSYSQVKLSSVDPLESILDLVNKKENKLSLMDGRDLYRILRTEAENNVKCYTVSKENENHYSDNHLSTDFSNRNFVPKLQSTFPRITFNEIICDWFWFPSSWFSKEGNNKNVLFTKNIIELATEGILEGNMFFPFNGFFLERIAVHHELIEKYYHIRFLDSSSNQQSSLWNTTKNIDRSILTDLGKDPHQQDIYCTITSRSHLLQLINGVDITIGNVIEFLKKRTTHRGETMDISTIRTICLQRKDDV